MSTEYTAYGPVKSSDGYLNAVCYGITLPFVDSLVFLGLRKLTTVNISHNDLSGPIDLLLAPAVTSLDGSHNSFITVKPFKKFKPSHSSLRLFDLSSNVISQDFAQLFAEKPPNLEEIDLSNNSISGSIHTSEQFVFLRRLIIGSNKLSGALPNLPSKFPDLVDLDLSSNMITGSINGGLTNHPILKTLDLSGNMLTSFHETAVLSNLVQMNHMDLSENKLGPTIPRDIGKLKDKLTVLDLSNNNFESTIPSELGSLQSDATVRLAGNHFVSIGYFDLSDQSEYCPSERAALADFYNEAKGLEWTESLSWLDDYNSHCLWKGVTCDDEDRTIKIELRGNGLSGRLSSSIGKLKNLRELDISDNDIKDTIPSEIGLLEQLEFLKLSFNQFQREVPPEVENLKKLKLFQAHANRITGTVTLYAGLVPDEYEESSFVTDCGSPSLFGDDPGPVTCASCTMCCNEFEECYPAKTNGFLEWKNYKDFGWILLACVVASLCLLNGVSALWDYSKNRGKGTVRRRSSRYIRQKSEADEKYAIKSMGEGSVYSFFLHDDKLAWSISLVTLALQFWLLHPFIIAAEFDLSDDMKDLVYTWKCDRVSDECEDLGDLTWQGWFLFVLFIMEIDERAFETIDSVNQRWVDEVTKRKRMDEDTISSRGIGEKSDCVLTLEQVEALLEQRTHHLEDRLEQQTRQLKEIKEQLKEREQTQAILKSGCNCATS
ncbi:hypothetical protein THAOC_31450 [Thalassiosira oceanica]|uniref:Leucine-rich repeat-containing N-terminal plant-type domain-containing protein n=1 Tax=Thalassiosira oceanica TaxID=159749 RepID=K0R994_THAOC|nr:hypothetical protein THAOC_31450 [Thalassiosira oceanica]|eukprot:EJK49650.1 hypothetical protein THAOC_31450 [Thalassiosira oceanica]